MTTKQVIPRRLAIRDVDEIIEYYLETSSEAIALGFVDALESAYAEIGSNPAIGSPRYAYELELPGLRSWPLKRYPYLIFYLERDAHIDVWRVLHGRRDVPLWMHEQDESE
ncbi:MAG: type II toxin-antitoxin system RelE/ParE family toxin [Lamprobacter sp.]|uniref:type II toxin-antitoxin system RelE/ParE family toxin n=1 Tax=Lamprobacter sp. TaxID=3100796 RepID=UPI002B2591EE|nr:type II toxin-antitoxin system RelE/ParE family toxin [Lamprobacter sp.]MEA3643576.1 type II toxin-antitoxin system RelE/ParE family toxin [Lamprobacter sp.]